MAKSYFSCAKCGADTLVVGRNRADADRLAAWHQKQGHICAACESEQHAIQNAAAGDANAAAGLPALTGSEKQVAWAETIRRQMLADFDMLAPVIAAFGSLTRVNMATDEELQAIKVGVQAALDVIKAGDRWHYQQWAREILEAIESADAFTILVQLVREQTRAAWWIDHRGAGVATTAKSLKAQIEERITALRPMPPELCALEAAAQEEALLKPAGEPKSPQIAEISFVAPALRVVMPEKNEAFRLAIKKLGFHWSETRWVRSIDFRAGSPIDRMAEIAHRLIGAGFMVRLHDDEARTKALSGDFQAEQTRWIVAAKGGAYDGWVKIVWPRSDDLYSPAKRIIGSRYHDGAVYAPPGSIEEVAEFAQAYGFEMSQTPAALLAAHRSALASGAVIADPKAAPAPLRVPDTSKPENLDVPTAGIDDDLLDNL